MHTFSIAQLLALGLLVVAPLASAYVDVAGAGGEELTNKRSFVVSSIVNIYPRPRAYIIRVDILLVLALCRWRPGITLRRRCKDPANDV
jgi:hypothetical protein